MTHDAPTSWTVEEREAVLDCRIFAVERHHSRTVDDAKHADFFVLRSKDWVNVIPVTIDQQVVLVEQFRHGIGQLSLEIPGGIAETGEDVLAAAGRELREETGYTGRPRLLGSCAANPAFMTNRFSAVVIEDCRLTDATAFDEHEDLKVHLVPASELAGLLRRGAIQNGYSVLAISWYLLGYGPGL